MQKSNKMHIAYLDLLGIKDKAKYSVESYYGSVDQFVCMLKSCESVFKNNNKYKKSHVYYFSDCAFIQCERLEALFEYIRNLRYALICNCEPLMFTAAIGLSEIEGLENTLCLGAEKDTYVSGISFGNKDICSVYVLQNIYKGIGVFIDEPVLTEWEKSFVTESGISFEKVKQKYISKSFYFPTLDDKNPVCYYDLKMSKNEIKSGCLQQVFERYHSADMKNRKYGRFYLSYLANWIVSEIYNRTEEDESSDAKDNVESLLISPYLVGNSFGIIRRLRRHAYEFNLLLFFLFNELANSSSQRYANEIRNIMEFIISSPTTQRYLNDLDQIPDSILSMENKDMLINEYQNILRSKDNNYK